MSRIGFVALLFLGACAAQGPVYSGQKGIIVYRDAPVEMGAWQIEMDGRPVCDLHPRSFFVVDKDKVFLSASKFTMGTSRYEAKAGQVIRIGLDTAHSGASLVGGVIGSGIAQGLDNSGPFDFVPTDASRLAGLHQDCM